MPDSDAQAARNRRWTASEEFPADKAGTGPASPELLPGLLAGGSTVPIMGLAGRSVRASSAMLGGRRVILARSVSGERRGALRREDGANIAAAARMALANRLPLVLLVASSGSDVTEGIDALHGWGEAAAAVAACSGCVPVLAAVSGPAVSGPALLLGLSDVVVMTPDSFAFVSGPEMVVEFTGMRVGIADLGGSSVHASRSGLASLLAADAQVALDLLGNLLSYLPDHGDSLAGTLVSDDPPDRPTPELASLVPASSTESYDVRQVIRSIADEGEMLELHPAWAPQLVTALCHVGGIAVGVVANQPRSLAGTLDIPASQKGAGFVRFCDSFNLPIVTLVDTPGFLPGKDLEWRGMIRHGAELAFAYAEATVPRVCLVLRKAYGGAYIVMDSKGLGNDLCIAWPTAEIAVMGAQGAVQILHRNASPEERLALEAEYADELLGPWVAAERGYVDAIIDPADTRATLTSYLGMLSTRRERLPRRKHDNGPL